MSSWVVACVTPRREFEFAGMLAERQLVAFTPTFHAMTRPKHKKRAVSVKKPLLPGWVFIETDGTVPNFEGQQHFRSFVRSGGRTCSIPEPDMRKFMAVCEEFSTKIGAPEPRKSVPNGIRASIKRGLMQGYAATVVCGTPNAAGRIVVEVSGKRFEMPMSFL